MTDDSDYKNISQILGVESIEDTPFCKMLESLDKSENIPDAQNMLDKGLKMAEQMTKEGHTDILGVLDFIDNAQSCLDSVNKLLASLESTSQAVLQAGLEDPLRIKTHSIEPEASINCEHENCNCQKKGEGLSS